MSYLEPTSGGLEQNRCCTEGSIFRDIQQELGITWRRDDVAMGWREESPGFVGPTVEWGAGVFGSLLNGQLRNQFG